MNKDVYVLYVYYIDILIHKDFFKSKEEAEEEIKQYRNEDGLLTFDIQHFKGEAE